ncbi:MATE family efflux transporter [Desulfosporosinus sp. PR]|uniref:MATE family efflux transporter n=1 Tax=Candidatus Desulfosporosinus nitrosoreducens TaxID=3401928 RepID=UPI0027FBFEB2|nr:MATE family efflux transporter [Desulfosporosinus sp. PR]MDQ7092332.1 MATE family efflux transporter [Desulfosporosinus sp. PR]
MKQGDSSNYYFEDAPIGRAIMHMSLPMMLGMCLNVIYNIIDAFFIGKLNQTPMMSAIALALPFSTILMAIGNLFGTGGGTYISRLLGEKNLKEAQRVSAVTFYFSLISGLLLIILCTPFLPSLLQLLGAKGDTLLPTRNFILVSLLGSPVVVANFALGQIVRAEGASKESMYGMAVSVLVNIMLDPILIFTCHMGVMGAALATVLGNFGAVIYYVFYLQKKSMTLTVAAESFKPNWRMTGEIFKIGVSAMIMDLFLIVSTLLLNNFSAAYGDYAVAAFGISQRVVQLSDFIGMGLFMGIVPLVAYSYTARDIRRMMGIIKTTTAYITVLVAAVSATLLLFRIQVIKLFTADPQVIKVGIVILAAMLISSLFTSYSGLFTGIFQGIGREKEAAIMSMAQGVFLIPIMIMGNIWFGLDGVIWSMAVAEVLASLIGLGLWIHFRKNSALKDFLRQPEQPPFCTDWMD